MHVHGVCSNPIEKIIRLKHLHSWFCFVFYFIWNVNVTLHHIHHLIQSVWNLIQNKLSWKCNTFFCVPHMWNTNLTKIEGYETWVRDNRQKRRGGSDLWTECVSDRVLIVWHWLETCQMSRNGVVVHWGHSHSPKVLISLLVGSQ